jgi:dihydrofolate reductase
LKKLKLLVQMSIDGYIAGPNGEMDWMVWNWDDKLKNYVFELHKPVDTILLGRKMTDGFVSYWSDVMTKPDDPSSIDRSHAFAKKVIETPKVVFTKTLKNRNGQIRTSLMVILQMKSSAMSKVKKHLVYC